MDLSSLCSEQLENEAQTAAVSNSGEAVDHALQPAHSEHGDPVCTTDTGHNADDLQLSNNSPPPVVLSNRVKPDRRYHKQLLLTAFTMATYFALGLMPSQTGVSFLDLIQLVGTDIGRGSLIFTLSSLGYMIGSMIGGHLFDKLNKEVIFGTCALLAGAITVAYPWCPWLPLMVAIIFTRSLFTGAMDSGGTVILLKIWGKEVNPYMQTLHFMYALGGVCSPLLTEPFLMPTPGESTNVSFANTSYINASTENNTYILRKADVLFSTTTVTIESTSLLSAIHPVMYKSRLYIPHLMVGVYTALTSLPFFAIFLLTRRNKSMLATNSDPVAQKQASGDQQRAHWVFLAIFGIYFFTYGCTEEVYAAFLMPFVVKYLQWHKSSGAQANSVYWGSFAGGRFLGIFVAKILNVEKMILKDFVLIMLGLIGLLISSGKSDVAIWICNGIVGLATASVFASSVTWLDQNVRPVTGKVAGFFVVAMSSGTMCNTALLGYLFEEVSTMWFIYLNIANTSVSLILFVLLFVTLRHAKKTKSVVKEGNIELEISHKDS